MKRARVLLVLIALLGAGIALASSTQTWFLVTLAAASDEPLEVLGSVAVPMLTAISIAVLALAAALSIAGRVLVWVIGALLLTLGALLIVVIVPIASEHPVSAVAPAVTEATGMAGAEVVSTLISGITATGWPWVAVAAAAIVAASGVGVLSTCWRWPASGRRYRTDRPRSTNADSSAPLDAQDSWDDLSHGHDPT